MRISFTYHGTIRHGVLLGVFSSAENRLILSVREDGTGGAVKSFSAEKMTNVGSVLEFHEQVPGVLAVEDPQPQVSKARIDDLQDRMEDLENLDIESRLDALERAIDGARTAFNL